jgi:hypothetical protein
VLTFRPELPAHFSTGADTGRTHHVSPAVFAVAHVVTASLTTRIADIVGRRDGRNSGLGVSASCRCRDVAVTHGAMGSHGYLMGGGLSAYDASSPSAGRRGSFDNNWIEGLRQGDPPEGDWVS